MSDSVSQFFVTFGVFFPAVNGIIGGTNITGTLRVYSLFHVLISEFCKEYSIWNSLFNRYIHIFLYFAFFGGRYSIFFFHLIASVCIKEVPGSNEYGLYWDNYIFSHVSFWTPILYIGLSSAILSTGLTALAAAPRVFQVMIYMSF